jgi:hypothetical protein
MLLSVFGIICPGTSLQEITPAPGVTDCHPFKKWDSIRGAIKVGGTGFLPWIFVFCAYQGQPFHGWLFHSTDGYFWVLTIIILAIIRSWMAEGVGFEPTDLLLSNDGSLTVLVQFKKDNYSISVDNNRCRRFNLNTHGRYCFTTSPKKRKRPLRTI